MRIQKYLSQSGICSRRKAEQYIEKGEVYVNGVKAHIGQDIDEYTDTIQLGNTAIQEQRAYVYYVYHKPRGIETTCADRSGKSILDILDIPERVFPVGRLDKETTGLIILTNDGRMTNYLTHPRYGHEKEYIVEVFGSIDDTALHTLAAGVHILGKQTQPCHIQRIASGKFSIILKEGRNRQIRRMVTHVGHTVKKLKRIRIENIFLGNQPIGSYRQMTYAEKKALFSRIGLPF